MSGRPGGRAVLLEELTSPEFEKRARKKPLVIVPFGSVEEHGPHLPLCTDAYQAESVALRVAERFDALVCPAMRYGESRSTRNFPGTLSLSSDTVRGLTRDIVSELARNGIDKIMILTGHAGTAHVTALRDGALSVVERVKGLRVMVLSDYDIAYDLRGKEFPEDDGHAGMIETSRMLNIRPELVRPPRPVGRERPPKFMVVSDPERFFPTGVVGDSRGASAAKGARIDDYIVQKLSQLVVENFGLRQVR
ncbi:MAG: creatininase family protein [Thermoplasmata archaeon]